jgi:polar amino acid transport system substrate-binding protein
MNVTAVGASVARVALTVLLATAACGAVAFAQEPPRTPPAKGYDDPEGVPLRPPAVDVEPVWAKPAIDTLATVRKRGTLRVGVVDNAPFVMHNAAGELTGFSIDLGRRMAADLGVDIEFVPTSWSQVVADLVGRHFDVIATGLWVTPARALMVNFSEPTSVGAMHLVANKSLTSSMKSREDFNRPDVRLVVFAGTSQEAVAARLFPKASLVKVEGDADPLAPVLEGKAHAALVTTPTPLLVVSQAPDRLAVPLDAPLQTTTTAAAIRKGDPDFLNFIDSWLAFQREDGWLAERQHYWFRTTEWLKGM